MTKIGPIFKINLFKNLSFKKMSSLEFGFLIKDFLKGFFRKINSILTYLNDLEILNLAIFVTSAFPHFKNLGKKIILIDTPQPKTC